MKPKRNNIQKDILFILISSFIVVVAWIGFNIYHIWATSTLSQDLQLELTPISPDFDPQTIQQLKTRENVEPLFEIQKGAAPVTTQNGTPAPTPLISGVPQVTTQSGTAASSTPQLAPINSPIDKVGQ